MFKLLKDGSGYAMLHSCDYWNDDGYGPVDLVEGKDGMLYGATGNTTGVDP